MIEWRQRPILTGEAVISNAPRGGQQAVSRDTQNLSLLAMSEASDLRGVLEPVELEAPSIQLERGDERVALSSYWHGRAAVLVFLRHFG